MRPRQTIIEQFSCFARLADGGFHGWSCDPRLKKSIQQQLEQVPESPGKEHSHDVTTEQFWSIYWHQCWQSQSHRLAETHLVAYLQEPCYWVSQEVTRKFRSIQAGVSSSDTMLDYFQMAVANVRLALAKFSPERSSHLKAFVQVFLASSLKSTLRQRRQVDFCTTWGLLRKTSQKRLLEALAGFPPHEHDQSRLLFIGFQTLYVPTHAGGSARLPEPDEQLWQGLADFYNQKRTSFLTRPGPQLTAEQVEDQIKKMARWIRRYLYPAVDSLNQPFSNADGEGGELMDRLSDDPEQLTLDDVQARSLLDNLVEQEREAEQDQAQSQLRQVFAAAFLQLDEQTRQILCLLYGQGLPQQQVMTHMGVSQPTISRRVKKARQQLQSALLQWATEIMNKQPDPDQLVNMTPLLEEWLKVYLRETDLCG